MKMSSIIFVMLLTVAALTSCERTGMGLEPALTAGKTSAIQRGEPITFVFETGARDKEIEWKVTPQNKISITSMGKTAIIKFAEAGSYLISATDKINSARSTVTVDTSAYSLTDTTKIVLPDTVGTHDVFLDLKNATFTLTPTIIDTLSTAGLGFRIESNNSYPCTNSYLNFNHFFENSETKSFRLNIYNVVQPGARYCKEGDKKVSAGTLIYPLIEGDNGIEIGINGNVYSGIITKNKNTFSITWPDTSVIKFSSLTLTK